MREEPFFRKCCFNIPLQSCLQIWACTKLMTDISITLFLIHLIISIFIKSVRFEEFTLLAASLIVIAAMMTDGAFMLVLSVALHKKNLRGLRVIYCYSLFMMIIGCFSVLLIFIYGVAANDLLGESKWFPVFVICGVINTSIDVCIILTLKSEMINIRNKQKFEFVRMPGLREIERAPSFCINSTE